jgi:hypothetical protein
MHHNDADDLLSIGEMVQLIHFEYSATEREILKHDHEFEKGEKRNGPGDAHLDEYHRFKHYHDHSLKVHAKSGKLDEEAQVPFWPLDKENMIEHHSNVDFNFNFDL